MSLADELLATINGDAAIHDHIVSDLDSYFIIDPDSREIVNAAAVKNTVMQFDHMSEIYTFEVPRYVEGHDMALCNRVRVHFINIDDTSGTEHRDVAEIDDLALDPEDENRVLSTWTIRREATQLAGNLSFAVQYMCVADDGEVVYEWHTDIYSDVDVKRSLNNSEAAVIEYTNILEDWYQKLFGEQNRDILDTALHTALTQAKVSGEFDGEKGEKGEKGDKGDAYVLTPADKEEIAEMAADSVKESIGDMAAKQPDWSQNDPEAPDYVKGRTHYEENSQTVIEWEGENGSVEGLDYFIHPGYGGDLKWYKLSDQPIIKDGVIPDHSLDVVMEGVITHMPPDDVPTDEADVMMKEMWYEHQGGWYFGDWILSVESEHTCGTDTETVHVGRGTYFAYYPTCDDYTEIYVRKLTYGSTTVHPLDEKFIPDSIKLPAVTTENNGAFLRVIDGTWAVVKMTDVSVEGA